MGLEFVDVCKCGFCNMWVCVWVRNVLMCVSVGSVICGFVYVWVCVYVGFFNVLLCVYVGFVMCGCLYVWVLLCVDVWVL
jgi:hypothetical protein